MWLQHRLALKRAGEFARRQINLQGSQFLSVVFLAARPCSAGKGQDPLFAQDTPQLLPGLLSSGALCLRARTTDRNPRTSVVESAFTVANRFTKGKIASAG